MKSVAAHVGADGNAEPLASLCGAPPDAVAQATQAAEARIPSISESHHELTGGDLSRKPCLASLVEELAEDQLRQQNTCASNEIPPLTDENLLTPEFCHALVAAARHDALPHAAVTIVAYREPELLRRTLRRLRSPRFARMVHLDLRTDAAFEAAVLALADEEAAAGAPLCVVKSHTIVYRTGTDIEVVMGALAWWVARAPAGRFDYFVPLTGSDYPLWTADELSWLLREAETGRDGPVTWLRAGPGHAQCRRGAALMEEPRWKDEFGARMLSFAFPCVGAGATAGSAAAGAPPAPPPLPPESILVRPRRPWLFEAHSSFDDAVAADELLFCWTRPMSTGVYAWDAARFLVDDPRARRAFHFFRRAGHGQVEHYWSSTLASWYSPRRLLDRDPALMSWHRGVYVGARHGVSNSFLTASELDFVKAGMWMAHLFVRKVSLLEHNGTVGLLDAIDAGAAAGLPTAAAAAAAARAPRGGLAEAEAADAALDAGIVAELSGTMVDHATDEERRKWAAMTPGLE